MLGITARTKPSAKPARMSRGKPITTRCRRPNLPRFGRRVASEGCEVGAAVCAAAHKCSKLLAYRRLKGAQAQGFVPSLMLTALRQIEPFLRHFDERRADRGIRSLLGC